MRTTTLTFLVFFLLLGIIAACRGQEAVPLDSPTMLPSDTPTPVPVGTPTMYKLAPDTYAPPGVWKALEDDPYVNMLIAAETQLPDVDSGEHAVLLLKYNCDSFDYLFGVLPSIALSQEKYLKAEVMLSGGQEYKTTWWDISTEGQPAELWRLYDTAQEQYWTSDYHSRESEKPFWDSLVPGLYAGKDFHFTIDGHLSVTFDAAGFQDEWDSLEQACFFRGASSTSESGGQGVQVSQQEYREWALGMDDRGPRLERAIALCDAEHDIMNDAAVVAAFERFADAESATSEVAKRVLPAGYDARYDTVPDEVWVEIAPYAPEFMAAGTQYIDALTEAILSVGCEL